MIVTTSYAIHWHNLSEYLWNITWNISGNVEKCVLRSVVLGAIMTKTPWILTYDIKTYNSWKIERVCFTFLISAHINKY